ncbi:MAG: transglutaminase domain-containing protein [Fimbriimonas sp.]|nr:transglutaminase domain-containing protein [Fimbriimonas sp.]
MIATSSLICIVLALGATLAVQTPKEPAKSRSNPPTLESSLLRAPDRSAEWNAWLQSLPADERKGGEYLLTYMPVSDLKHLKVSYLSSALELAYHARTTLPWGKRIPLDVFLDSVLPYSSVTEPRQSMRAEFQQKYLPLVASSKTPGEAALAVNRSLFKDYKVTYNTRRLRTDQSPPETIAQGMATCTGLSVMLVDALRAVGVPSRLAGIHSWPGRGGNHTWVEVWDKGTWHFVGAAEPDDAGLDHAWFGDEAGRAIAAKPENSIWAATYRDDGTYFPMVWAPEARVPAVNVTKRYNKRLLDLSPRLMVEVKKGGERVIADVIAYNAATGDRCLIGKSKGPQADINLHLAAPVTKGGEYLVTTEYAGQSATAIAKVDQDTVVRIDLDNPSAGGIEAVLADRFSGDTGKAEAARKLIEKLPFDEATARAAWTAFRSAPDAELKKEFDAKTVSTPDRTSPYLWRTVGTKPEHGWGLVIAMHGGGNAPKQVNDGEWKYMFRGYYKDHAEAGGYVYLALRAPNDTWNGFYDDAICPLIERLILQFVKFADVDPSRVYACGASHGGYGAYVIGPKIPYRFAAVHPAASAATDGETEGVNLRNLRFTWAVGENDKDYGRIDRCRAFEKQWEDWRKEYGGFDGGLEVVPGHGHLINDFEANKTAEFLKFTRNATPSRVIWVQTDTVLHRFYWLESLAPKPKGRIDANIAKNTITLKTSDQGEIALWLSPSLVDLKKPVVVIRDGKRTAFRLKPSLQTYADGLAETGDPALTAPVRVVVK